ncbi:hypothetical protein ABIC64_000001, partial [Plantibacter flavus]
AGMYVGAMGAGGAPHPPDLPIRALPATATSL